MTREYKTANDADVTALTEALSLSRRQGDGESLTETSELQEPRGR